MCFSAEASFVMAGVLMSGGAFCVQKSMDIDRKYLAMAAMPLAVGFQQFMEGMVWTGAGTNNAGLMYAAAFSYMFFVWVFWPSWVPFVVSTLEPNKIKKKLFSLMAGIGLAYGLWLYIPLVLYPDWLQVGIVRSSLAYEITCYTDKYFSQNLLYFFYLTLVALPPLLSSHNYLRLFGWLLVASVPLTYFVFIYAYISTLCFFAAAATAGFIFIIAGDKCRDAPDTLALSEYK